MLGFCKIWCLAPEDIYRTGCLRTTPVTLPPQHPPTSNFRKSTLSEAIFWPFTVVQIWNPVSKYQPSSGQNIIVKVFGWFAQSGFSFKSTKSRHTGNFGGLFRMTGIRLVTQLPTEYHCEGMVGLLRAGSVLSLRRADTAT